MEEKIKMARKQKLLVNSSANLTVLQQEAKYKAEFLARDGLKKVKVDPPSWLKGEARKEYKRIVENIGDLPLRDLDHAELESYATWYSEYRLVNIELNSKNLTQDKHDRLLSRLDKITKNIKGLASDLGLTVNSRLQMNMPKNDDKPKDSIMERFG